MRRGTLLGSSGSVGTRGRGGNARRPGRVAVEALAGRRKPEPRGAQAGPGSARRRPPRSARDGRADAVLSRGRTNGQRERMAAATKLANGLALDAYATGERAR